MDGYLLRRGWRPARLALIVALVALALGAAGEVAGEGSGTLYRGEDPTRFRSHLEWRTSFYGGGDSERFEIRRRTLLYVFAQRGETILLGSSGIAAGAPNLGDIQVFAPAALLSDVIGREEFADLAGAPAEPQPGAFANGFSCVAQRNALNDQVRGRIASRQQEQAGPLPNPNGYEPCAYRVPETAIYAVRFTGPSGPTSNDEPSEISGLLESPAADFGPRQRTSVTAWDVTVRDGGGITRPGRLFAYYYAANTGGNGRPISGQAFVVTDSGFRYRVVFDGDPFGFIFFSNQFGFENSDNTPLYRNLLADPRAGTQDQNQLRQLQGGVGLLPPEHPLFIAEPDPLVLDALGIPRQPLVPEIRELRFRGPDGSDSAPIGAGGEFRFVTSQAGAFYLVVSRDEQSFDPEAPGNRLLRGVAEAPGPVVVPWDGRDNSGEPFPAGTFAVAGVIQGGEVHFPFLDVENNLAGGPVIELANPPDVTGDNAPDCPPWNGGCFGAFYDDRGYRAANDLLVGTAVDGPLCPGDAQNPRGFGNPPLILASDPARGFDTRTTQRAFGFASGGNPGGVCQRDGGFGDKKGLDLWTFYPSNVVRAPLRVVDITAVTLRSLTASREGGAVVVRWETGVELGTRGFHILRSATGSLDDAARVTQALIPARGGASAGAAYSWADEAAADAATPFAYWIEEVEGSGATSRYGPVRAAPGPAAAPSRLYLPLVRR